MCLWPLTVLPAGRVLRLAAHVLLPTGIVYTHEQSIVRRECIGDDDGDQHTHRHRYGIADA